MTTHILSSGGNRKPCCNQIIQSQKQEPLSRESRDNRSSKCWSSRQVVPGKLFRSTMFRRSWLIHDILIDWLIDWFTGLLVFAASLRELLRGFTIWQCLIKKCSIGVKGDDVTLSAQALWLPPPTVMSQFTNTSCGTLLHHCSTVTC